MQDTYGNHWTTDHDLFRELPGGAQVIEWFGFIPSFHDASLDKIEIANGTVTMRLKAFRMTSEVDDRGYFVLDRHALVTLYFSRVSGISLAGDAQSSIAELGIRRITTVPAVWETCCGPRAGNIEVSFDTNIGLEGSIFAHDLTMALDPVQA